MARNMSGWETDTKYVFKWTISFMFSCHSPLSLSPLLTEEEADKSCSSVSEVNRMENSQSFFGICSPQGLSQKMCCPEGDSQYHRWRQGRNWRFLQMNHLQKDQPNWEQNSTRCHLLFSSICSFPMGFSQNPRIEKEGDQNMPLWLKDYFKTKKIENQQVQKKTFLKLL